MGHVALRFKAYCMTWWLAILRGVKLSISHSVVQSEELELVPVLFPNGLAVSTSTERLQVPCYKWALGSE